MRRRRINSTAGRREGMEQRTGEGREERRGNAAEKRRAITEEGDTERADR